MTPERRPLEAVLRNDRRVVIATLLVGIVLSWAYLLAGAGMDMSGMDMGGMDMSGREASETDMSTDMSAMARPERDVPETATARPDTPGTAGAGTDMPGMTMSDSTDSPSDTFATDPPRTDQTSPMTMPMPTPSGMQTRAQWDAPYALLMFTMWWVMMIAMMLPSAAPMILLFTELNRRNADGSRTTVNAFILAYIVAWGGFSAVAVALQWGLEEAGLLDAMMTSTSAILGGALLIAAGIWQLTPLKHACLRHCRTPIHFFAHGWKPGVSGAFRMGLEHGAFCLGCCWVLMALLFYGGVMNLWWIVGLTLYVLIEKIVPAGHRIGSVTGALLIAWGVTVIAVAA